MTGWFMLQHMHTVPLYIHVPVVLALVALHGSTVYWARKRIRELEGALSTRDQLLDVHDVDGAHIAAGGTLVQTFERPVRRVRITSRFWTYLKVEYDH